LVTVQIVCCTFKPFFTPTRIEVTWLSLPSHPKTVGRDEYFNFKRASVFQTRIVIIIVICLKQALTLFARLHHLPLMNPVSWLSRICVCKSWVWFSCSNYVFFVHDGPFFFQLACALHLRNNLMTDLSHGWMDPTMDRLECDVGSNLGLPSNVHRATFQVVHRLFLKRGHSLHLLLLFVFLSAKKMRNFMPLTQLKLITSPDKYFLFL